MLNSKTAKCIQLTIEIPHFVGQGNVPVMFPSADEIKTFAWEMAQGAVSAVS